MAKTNHGIHSSQSQLLLAETNEDIAYFSTLKSMSKDFIDKRKFVESSVRCIFAIENNSIDANDSPPDLRHQYLLFR